MRGKWERFLSDAPPSAHGVELYSDDDDLAASVADYLADGFSRGEPAIAVATADHLARVAERLSARGYHLDELVATELLVTADARATLASLMTAGEPRADLFENVIGGLIDRVAARFPGSRPRVFGEMVDVLVRESKPVAAVALEELWNRLARTRDFTLLCGYHVDVFDRETQAALLPELCRLHSHVRPAHDEERFAKAVDGALEEVLGAAGAGQVYVLVADELRAERVPAPQLVLMWVSENMPLLAERILTAARGRYLDMPPTPPSDSPRREAPAPTDPRWRATLREATRPRETIFFRDE